MTNTDGNVIEVLQAFGRGEIIVVMDDHGRENEGDLIVAAMHCTPEKMAFIVRHTSGIVCAALPHKEAKRLNLAPMVVKNDSPHSTAFTVTVDYRYGTTTGISANDRTLTVRNLADPNSVAEDFFRPGHIFPLIACQGGVLMRSGHTEAAVDLCKLAGLPPVGVLCELVNDDGTVMRGLQVSAFAKTYNLRQITVADLIAYRRCKEKLVEHRGEMAIETVAGPAIAHTYQLPWETMQHVAIIIGDISDGENILVRFHRENVLNDVFSNTHELDMILLRMKEKKHGVLVYLREGAIGVSLESRDLRKSKQRIMEDQEDHAEAVVREEEWHHIGLGAQILRHLSLSSIILLASKERHYIGVEGFGIQIVCTEIM